MARTAEVTVHAWLELHDSTLERIASAGAQLELLIDGYVHRWEKRGAEWTGSGWMQRVRILFTDAEDHSAVPHVPIDIAKGFVESRSHVLDNVVPLPLLSVQPAHMRLELVDGTSLAVRAGAIRIEAGGPARFVEDLPSDLRPVTDSDPR